MDELSSSLCCITGVELLGLGVISSSASSAMLTMSMKLEEGDCSNEPLGLARGRILGELDGLVCLSGDVVGEGEKLRPAGAAGEDCVRAIGGAVGLPEDTACGRRKPREYGERLRIR